MNPDVAKRSPWILIVDNEQRNRDSGISCGRKSHWIFVRARPPCSAVAVADQRSSIAPLATEVALTRD